MHTQDSIQKIIRSLPKDCLTSDSSSSYYYLIRDFLLVGFFAWAILAVDSWIFGILLAFPLGAAVGGLFVLGHDCGHRSFSKSKLVNDIVGHITTSHVFWPFHMWRLDHDAHHMATAHIDKETAWRPVTYRLWKRMPKLQRYIYFYTRTYLFFLGSVYTTWVQIKEGLKAQTSEKFSDTQKKEIKLSMTIMFITGFSYLFGSIALGGFYGFMCLFLIPQLVFHSLLSTFTFFHHTTPEKQFLNRKTWTPESAQLAGSLHFDYPKVLEFFTHDITWHVPHHVCVGIPHYKLRKAHKSLKESYPDDVYEGKFDWKHIKEVITQCHFIRSRNDASWISISQAKAEEAQESKSRPAKKPIAQVPIAGKT